MKRIIAGLFFSPFLGTLYAAAGATIEAAIAFLLFRYLGREIVAKHLSGQVTFCTQCSDHLLTKVVTIYRLRSGRKLMLKEKHDV